jgi:hypothetical protein
MEEMMKKVLMILVLFSTFAFGQKEIDQDSTSVDGAYTAYKRAGVKMLGRAESGLWRIMRVDSSGNIYVTEPLYDPAVMLDTTLAITTAWDTLELGRTYEKITLINASTTNTAHVGFSPDTSKNILIPPSIARVWSISTDTLVVKGTESANIIIDCANRKRY